MTAIWYVLQMGNKLVHIVAQLYSQTNDIVLLWILGVVPRTNFCLKVRRKMTNKLDLKTSSIVDLHKHPKKSQKDTLTLIEYLTLWKL